MCVDFTLDSVRIGRYGTRFSRMFWKITVWTQSATDDPEIQNLLLLLPRDIRFSTNEVRICCCACVYGESLLTSGERGIQE